MSNQHQFKNNLLHKTCCHGPLGPDEERRRAWLPAGSLVIWTQLIWQDLNIGSRFLFHQVQSQLAKFNLYGSLDNQSLARLSLYIHWFILKIAKSSIAFMGSILRLISWMQAISKVKSALHGYKNCRWNDLEMMTMFTHTGTHIKWFAPSWSNNSTSGEIENFNSLMNKYCPKMYAFRYFDMIRWFKV